jgi:hypothetical protein
MDRFSFFFAFYGLILGLAIAELLSGFARYARVRRLRDLEAQTALLATFTFLVICATWIDAWTTLQTVTLNLQGLWAPILIATSYYLAAALVFPHESDALDDLASYYRRRKRFVVGMLVAAELLVSVIFLPRYEDTIAHKPAVFWLFHVPFKALILGAYAWLMLARSRRSNIAALIALLIIFTIPYWTVGGISSWVDRHFDQSAKAAQARSSVPRPIPE